MKSLQLMIQTYTQNPKFGDVKQFQGELDAAAHKVQLLESELHAMETELVDVNNALENIKNQSPTTNQIKREKSPSGSLASSLLSTQVSVSSGSDSLDGGQNNRKPQGPDSGIYLTGNNKDPTSEWDEDVYDDLSTPSPAADLEKVIALYPFESDSADTIPMVENEEFIIIEGDQDGWTKVKRMDNRFFNDVGEGFVPTSFIKSLK